MNFIVVSIVKITEHEYTVCDIVRGKSVGNLGSLKKPLDPVMVDCRHDCYTYYIHYQHLFSSPVLCLSARIPRAQTSAHVTLISNTLWQQSRT